MRHIYGKIYLLQGLAENFRECERGSSERNGKGPARYSVGDIVNVSCLDSSRQSRNMVRSLSAWSCGMSFSIARTV
jgi:hypothetical protein